MALRHYSSSAGHCDQNCQYASQFLIIQWGRKGAISTVNNKKAP
ncbi:hypothetical protein HMPREF0454_04467 [Hafnia alvei ATCC 51873]|uniref:Uncharacterized protein n=1 Tax=Hafnia alvei ATCC 51873 TaxID=1002364 RepID=G9YCQ2_HAFAL|nr:hypothetical protein HMPREF0454_04467 [Hafnia alvei ATCC 51873]